MALRDILLHMSDDDLAQSRLDVARKLAQMHEAHLTALYVVRTVEIPTYVRAYIDEEILQAGQNRQLELAKDAEKAFLDQTSRNGISAEWRVAIGEDRELMNLHGRYADLAVVSQRHFATDVSSNSDNLAEELVQSSACPVLTVPYVGKWPQPGRRVLIGWNGRREAVRAVHDAMPFLEKAEEAIVYTVNPDDGDHISGADLCTHLARHGVNALAKSTVSKDVDAGDLFLSAAFDMDIDLVVMGAYGHSRLREQVMGGATRSVLDHMTVPVLMSH